MNCHEERRAGEERASRGLSRQARFRPHAGADRLRPDAGRSPSGRALRHPEASGAAALHFDFRLELDGVLKSWAVTRGPSLDPAEKRLAVRTEDHPLEYGSFEGTIPKGEYGGGEVMLWDRGTWTPKGDPHEGLEKGQLKFELHGERLKGGFSLVRLRSREKEKRENWLLVKERDERAAPLVGPDPEMDQERRHRAHVRRDHRRRRCSGARRKATPSRDRHAQSGAARREPFPCRAFGRRSSPFYRSRRRRGPSGCMR